MSEEKSSQENSQNKNRPQRRRRRKNNRNKNISAKSGHREQRSEAKTKSSSQESSNENKSRNRNRNKNRRNRSSKPNSPAKVQSKHENLLEQYLQARKKFYHVYGKSNKKLAQKAIKVYQSALANLRRFESTLKDWEQKALSKKIDAYPEDRQYSTTHSLEPVGEAVDFTGEFPDPHLLESQVKGKFKDDTEESVGTIEDYQKYKGLS